MARTMSKDSLIQKIAKLAEDITIRKAALAKMEKDLVGLKKDLEEMKRAELMDAISKSGKSIDEVYAFLGISDQ